MEMDRVSIPSPDSGYALKLIKEFQPLWSQHYKKNLITKVVTNLVIYQASKAGRAPTRSDVVKVVKALSINESSVGILDKETLLKCSKETIKGLHLADLLE